MFRPAGYAARHGTRATASIVHKGRGATFNPKVRFESADVDPFDDGWGSLAQAQARMIRAADGGHA